MSEGCVELQRLTGSWQLCCVRPEQTSEDRCTDGCTDRVRIPVTQTDRVRIPVTQLHSGTHTPVAFRFAEVHFLRREWGLLSLK